MKFPHDKVTACIAWTQENKEVGKKMCIKLERGHKLVECQLAGGLGEKNQEISRVNVWEMKSLWLSGTFGTTVADLKYVDW